MAGKINKIEVEKKIITIANYNENDYICLTDMVRGEAVSYTHLLIFFGKKRGQLQMLKVHR